MSLFILLYIYLGIALLLIAASLVVLTFTWRFRYLGPATYGIVAVFITSILLNILITGWYILRQDWSYQIGIDLFELASTAL